VALPGLYFAPGDARQSGGTGVASRDAQLWNVYYRGGRLFTAQAVSGGDITCWVHRIDVSVDPALRQQTYEISDAGHDSFMPYVLPDREDDDFALLTAWSGPEIFVGARYWNFAADGTLRGAEVVVDGTRANTSGRHGDYHAIGEDPVDPNRLWMIAQYMKNSSLAGNQRIASVRFEDQPPPASPPPVPDGKTVTAEVCLADTIKVMDYIGETAGCERVSLLGISFGALVASMAAEREPARVDKVVLSGFFYANLNPIVAVATATGPMAPLWFATNSGASFGGRIVHYYMIRKDIRDMSLLETWYVTLGAMIVNSAIMFPVQL